MYVGFDAAFRCALGIPPRDIRQVPKGWPVCRFSGRITSIETSEEFTMPNAFGANIEVVSCVCGRQPVQIGTVSPLRTPRTVQFRGIRERNRASFKNRAQLDDYCKKGPCLYYLWLSLVLSLTMLRMPHWFAGVLEAASNNSLAGGGQCRRPRFHNNYHSDLSPLKSWSGRGHKKTRKSCCPKNHYTRILLRGY